MGYARTSCPTTPSLEQAFYPNPATIAETALHMVRPHATWRPDPEEARLAYQARFRGPF
jgi:pyruvate dehydrogenase E1 component beta subunit